MLCGCPENAVKLLIKAGLIQERRVGGPALRDRAQRHPPLRAARPGRAVPQPRRVPRAPDALPPGHDPARPPGQHGRPPHDHRHAGSGRGPEPLHLLGQLRPGLDEELEAAGLAPERGRRAVPHEAQVRLRLDPQDRGAPRPARSSTATPSSSGAEPSRAGSASTATSSSTRASRPQVDLDPGSLPAALPYELPRALCLPRRLLGGPHRRGGRLGRRAGPAWPPSSSTAGELYLVDAGPDIEASLEALGLGIDDLSGIFHTHAHDDHFVGLTALLRARRRLSYFAVPWVRASVEAKLRALTGIGEREFRRYFEVRDLEEGRWNDLGGLEVLPYDVAPSRRDDGPALPRPGPSGWRDLRPLRRPRLLLRPRLHGRGGPGPSPGISAELVARTKAAYLESAEVKKVDVGGRVHPRLAPPTSPATNRASSCSATAPSRARRPTSLGARFARWQPSATRTSSSRARPPRRKAEQAEARDSLAPRSPDPRRSSARRLPSRCSRETPASSATLARKATVRGRASALAEPWPGSSPRARPRCSPEISTFGYLGPGDVFGEEGLLVEGCCLFEAVTSERSKSASSPRARWSRGPSCSGAFASSWSDASPWLSPPSTSPGRAPSR